jgi:hypothetical protein
VIAGYKPSNPWPDFLDHAGPFVSADNRVSERSAEVAGDQVFVGMTQAGGTKLSVRKGNRLPGTLPNCLSHLRFSLRPDPRAQEVQLVVVAEMEHFWKDGHADAVGFAQA